MGKYFDQRLAGLGATRIHEMGTGDDDSNIEDHFITWKEDMWKSVCTHFGISGDKIDVKSVHIPLVVLSYREFNNSACGNIV